MTLLDELLPGAQHYSLLAIATALYTVAVVNKQGMTSKLLWGCLITVGMVPISYITLSSLYWTMSCPWSWATACLLAHGIAVALLVPIATCLTQEYRSQKGRRKVRLEPKVS